MVRLEGFIVWAWPAQSFCYVALGLGTVGIVTHTEMGVRLWDSVILAYNTCVIVLRDPSYCVVRSVSFGKRIQGRLFNGEQKEGKLISPAPLHLICFHYVSSRSTYLHFIFQKLKIIFVVHHNRCPLSSLMRRWIYLTYFLILAKDSNNVLVIQSMNPFRAEYVCRFGPKTVSEKDHLYVWSWVSNICSGGRRA